MRPSRRRRFCEQFDQLLIGGREFEVAQIAPRDPPHRLSELRYGLSNELAGEEMKLDDPIGVFVGVREELIANSHVDRQLLPKLTDQTGGERFARLAFPAGKLPAALEVDAALAAGEEELAVA